MTKARELGRGFYARGAIAVARDLLGCRLSVSLSSGTVGGVISETEAYCGALDRACHGFGFLRSARTESMYRKPGTVYVYQIYGIHHCLNISVLAKDRPHAVLIRGLVPLYGIEEMARRRDKEAYAGTSPNPEITDGPGKLCQALGIDRAFDGCDITCGPLHISCNPEQAFPAVGVSPRVGLGKVGEFALMPWRFEMER